MKAKSWPVVFLFCLLSTPLVATAAGSMSAAVRLLKSPVGNQVLSWLSGNSIGAVRALELTQKEKLLEAALAKSRETFNSDVGREIMYIAEQSSSISQQFLTRSELRRIRELIAVGKGESTTPIEKISVRKLLSGKGKKNPGIDVTSRKFWQEATTQGTQADHLCAGNIYHFK